MVNTGLFETDLTLAVVFAILASSGFWAFITVIVQKHLENKYFVSSRESVEREMLIGLAHDRILSLGMKYIQRGYVTRDEYENINQYLYEPYSKLGGNGSAKKIMEELNKLPIRACLIAEKRKDL